MDYIHLIYKFWSKGQTHVCKYACMAFNSDCKGTMAEEGDPRCSSDHPALGNCVPGLEDHPGSGKCWVYCVEGCKNSGICKKTANGGHVCHCNS